MTRIGKRCGAPATMPFTILSLESARFRGPLSAISRKTTCYGATGAIISHTRDCDPLEAIWSEILTHFPHVVMDSSTNVRLDWKKGDLGLTTSNDFTTAFFLLFRQSWRARNCPRCKMFFIARKPKQQFCGTVCSGGSRLDSKRKWWNRVGVKRRKQAARLH
jgi:hypothetical protein